MNILKIESEEKSVMLARLCEWLKTDNVFHSYFPPNGRGMSVNHPKGYTAEYIFSTDNHKYDLYNIKNFDNAWRVLNWAYANQVINELDKFEEWLIDIVAIDEESGLGMTLFDLPPEKAQRRWLDKILKLAIEAEMMK